MKFKNLIWAFIIIGALGSVGHFFYKWSGDNKFVGYFFPVNESTWEHLKLLFFPTVIFSAVEYFLLKNKVTGYLPSAVASLIVGLLTIITVFYTYSGVLGFKIEWFNIAIYYIALIVMLTVKAMLINGRVFDSRLAGALSMIWLLSMAIMLVVFTYNPLQLGIFKEP